MKMLFRILSALVISTGLTVGVASADTVTCGGSISDTGPGSSNLVNCTDSNNIKVKCSNDGKIVNENDQSASSGGAFTVDNTTAGGANSGDANNSNNVVVNLDASCAPVPVATTTAPASSTTPTPAPAGGRGGGEVAIAPAPATTKAAQVVSALPETGSNSVLDATLAGLTLLGGLMLASRLGVLAYRRHSLK